VRYREIQERYGEILDEKSMEDTHRETRKSWMRETRRSIRNTGKFWMRDTGKSRGDTARSEMRDPLEIQWDRRKSWMRDTKKSWTRDTGRSMEDTVRSVWEIHGRYTERDRKILDERYKKIQKKIPGNPGLQIQRDPCRRSMKVTGKSRRNTEWSWMRNLGRSSTEEILCSEKCLQRER
jgi:hypothetical protein